ncbi:MAG: hypothetical protein WC179_07780 [Candidatus Cloacimonadaceae bacterium]
MKLEVFSPIVAEAEIRRYTLVGDDIYVRRYTNSTVPEWYRQLISDIIATDATITNLDSVISYLETLPAGYDQQILNLQNEDVTINASIQSLVTTTGSHTAAIANLDITKVDATSASAIALSTVATYFNDGSAGSWFNNQISTYASDISTNAMNISTLNSTYNDLSVRLEDTRKVTAGAYSEWDGTSTPLLGQFKYENNQWYQYLGGTVGPNNDGWQITSEAAIKNTVDDTNSELTTFAATVNSELTDLQSQIDGNITSWFHTYDTEYVSTDATYQSTQTGVNLVRCDLVWHVDTMYVFLSEIDTQNIDLNLETYPSAGRWRAVTNLAPDVKNYPAGQWTTNEERNNHLGDLAYNLVTGYAYRWTYEDLEDDPDQGFIYGWVLITDTDVTSVLTAAAKAQDTADGKRIVFFQATVPTNIIGSNGYITAITDGDLWVVSANTGSFVKGEIYAYVTGTLEGIDGTDWVLSTRYTAAINAVQNDLNTWRTTTYSSFVTDIQNQVDGKAESYYRETMPHPEGTNSAYAVWVGDLWKVPSNNNEYIYQLVGSTYKWVLTDVPDIVYDEIDTKKTIYTGTSVPSLPNLNDMWITAVGTVGYDDEEIYTWNGSSWVKPTKYTDDTAANRTVRAFSAVLASHPTAQGEGDLWTVTDQWYTASTGTTYGTTKTEYGRVVKRYTSGSWVTVANETRKLFSDVAWAGYASSLLYDPVSGGITGWEYGDGGTASGINTRSEFKINADIFKVANGTENYVPFTVNTVDHVVEFNGKVSFTNITDTPTINKTWVQTTQPSTGMIAGDTWIDTDDNNKMYSYDGTTWNPVGAGIKTYLQTTAPTTNLSVGDIWVDSDGNYKQYRYNGTSFVAIAYNPATAVNAGTTTINGGKITTGSVTATQIAANSITADKLDVANLSAITANIGTVTAGVLYDNTWDGTTYKMKIDLNNGEIHIV